MLLGLLSLQWSGLAAAVITTGLTPAGKEWVSHHLECCLEV